MKDRLPSGAADLDNLLGGGLIQNGINLLIGLPGTGKTILAQQYLFANGSATRPAFYLSTVSEPVEKMLRFCQPFGFFERKALNRSVFFGDLSVSLYEGGLPKVLEAIDAILREKHPGLIVIDSFKGLRLYNDGDSDFPWFLHALSERSAAYALSFIWVGEYQESEIGMAPECAVADAVVALSRETQAGHEVRQIHVPKLRAGGHLRGRHVFEITGAGFEVFPRIADIALPVAQRDGSVPSRFGVQMVDEAFGGLYRSATTTWIGGPPGTGKTTLGLHFILEGVRCGEVGIIASTQEDPSQLQRLAQGFGATLDTPLVKFLYQSPAEICLDAWGYALLNLVERYGAKRVVIDTMGDLLSAAESVDELREFAYSMVRRLRRVDASLVATRDVSEVYGVTNLGAYPVAQFADNLILLRYLEDPRRARRVFSILKSSGSPHDQALREYEIASAGFRQVDAELSSSGI